MGKLVGDRDGAGIFGCNSFYSEVNINGDYAGYFAGDVHITGDLTVDGSFPTSDINLKKDIRPIEEDVIEKLGELQCIRFKLKHPSEYENISDTISPERIAEELQSEKYTKDRIGLIAQELQTTFPEIVLEGQDGYLRVNYTELIPVLVKAINKQQQQIKELEALVGKDGLQKSIEQGECLDIENVDINPQLFQNKPNPFTDNTTIQFNIPKIESKAMINLYDLQGKQLRTYPIIDPGIGEIQIPGLDLQPGIYLYNLLVDGREIASKRMVLTER